MIRERLEDLRKIMKEQNIYAYIVPSSDYHQSEYVGDYFKTREFIQAENELKGSDITLFKMGGQKIITK